MAAGVAYINKAMGGRKACTHTNRREKMVMSVRTRISPSLSPRDRINQGSSCETRLIEAFSISRVTGND